MFQEPKNVCKELCKLPVKCLWYWLDPSIDDEEKFDFATN